MASRIVPENHGTNFGAIVARLVTRVGSRVDANAGSIARTMAETYAREMATFYEMVDKAHKSGYLDTAQGKALDMVVAILGISRRRKGMLTGRVEFSRNSPAPADIGIPAGFRVATSNTPGEKGEITIFATTTDATLKRGATSVEVGVREIEDGQAKNGKEALSDSGGLDPGVVKIMVRPLFGIDEVKNPGPLRRATEDENDEELRARARRALREGAGGTCEAIAASVREVGVQKVTVREPPDGPAGVIEVVVGDPDFSLVSESEKDVQRVNDVRRAIRESKPAGIRAPLLCAETIYFQPVFAVEPIDARLDDAGWARLRREIIGEILKFGDRLPMGEPISRKRFEATLLAHSGIGSVGTIEMQVRKKKDGDWTNHKPDEKGAWPLTSMELAVFDVADHQIKRLVPPTYRISLVATLPTTDVRKTDALRQAIREGLEAYESSFSEDKPFQLSYDALKTPLHSKSGILDLHEVIITDKDGKATKLEINGTYPLDKNARLELGRVDFVRGK